MTAAGANPMILKQGIDKSVGVVVKELEKLSKKIVSKNEIAQDWHGFRQ